MGHVFRAKNPYVVHVPEAAALASHLFLALEQVMKNTKRAALVWLDEHLEDYYRKESVEETSEERWPQVPYARKIQVRCSMKVSYLRASWIQGNVARRVTSQSG